MFKKFNSCGYLQKILSEITRLSEDSINVSIFFHINLYFLVPGQIDMTQNEIDRKFTLTIGSFSIDVK